MSEVERRLRGRFAGVEARLTGPDLAPPSAPAHVLRRVRRRQVGIVAITVLTAAAVVFGAVTGVAALVSSLERRVPAEPPEPFSPGALQAVGAQPISFEGLVVDTAGRLWSMTPGLTMYDPASGSFRTFTLADDPAFDTVADIAPAGAGGVWVLSPFWGEQRVRRIDVGGILETSAPVPAHVEQIAEGPDGVLWASGDGVWSWDGTSWVGAPGGLAFGASRIAVDAAGNVWAGVGGSGSGWVGVVRFHGTGWTTYTVQEMFRSADAPAHAPDRGWISRIVAGSAGDVWVGGRGGVAHFAGGTWTSYGSTALGLHIVGSIAVTDSGVWVGGQAVGGGGPAIARFDGTTWTPIVEGLEGDGGTENTRLAASPQGNVWASTNTGLFRLDGTRWVRATSERRPSDVGPLEAAGADELWTGDGTALGGIWHLQGNGWTHFGQDEGVPGGGPGSWVNALLAAPDGAVWAAMEGGLARFDGVAWERAEPGAHSALGLAPDGRVWTASLVDENWSDHPIWSVHPIGGGALPPLDALLTVSSIAVGPAGDVWAGSGGVWGDGGGLAHFDGERWRSVDPFGEGNDFLVTDLEIAPDGGVWVAIPSSSPPSWDGVVARYQDGVWTTFAEADGVPFWAPNGDLFLEEAPNGEILLSTWDGVFAFREGAWHLVYDVGCTGLSVAPDGTIWLAGDGIFRLPPT